MGVVIGLMVGLLTVFGNTVPGWDGERFDPSAPEVLLPEPWPAGSLELFDPVSNPVSLEGLRGSMVALFFGYTHCPDVCPITLNRLAALQEEGIGGDIPLEVVFVSLDPARDTPERLTEFVSRLPGRVLALTADEETVRTQAREFGVLVQVREDPSLPEGEYLVDHTARTYLIDPDGMVVATVPPMAPADDVRDAVEAALGTVR